MKSNLLFSISFGSVIQETRNKHKTWLLPSIYSSSHVPSTGKLYIGNLFFKSNSGDALNTPYSRIYFEILDLGGTMSFSHSYTQEREKIRGNEMACIDEKRLYNEYFLLVPLRYIYIRGEKQNKAKTFETAQRPLAYQFFRSLFLKRPQCSVWNTAPKPSHSIIINWAACDYSTDGLILRWKFWRNHFKCWRMHTHLL